MKINFSPRVLLPLLVLCGSARAALTPAPARPSLAVVQLLEDGKPVKIVCFGDSVTGVYYHTGSRRAWCDLLGLALERIYLNAKIEMINAGVSGNTTADGLARMERDVLSRNPQLVVVMFGLNDLARGRGPEEYRSNLGQIVKRARQRGAEVILMTTNSVYPDDARRPSLRVADYAEIVRQVGHALNVPVADCFRAYEEIDAVDHLAWTRLMSETIHPNMRGHKVFAEEVAWTISGKRISLDYLPALQPEFPRVLARLRARQPVRAVAMKPYDHLIGPALQKLFPGADIQVTSWSADGKSLSEIAEQAKSIGWFKYFRRHDLDDQKPDLMVVAIPIQALAPSGEDFFRRYSEIINWSLAVEKGGGWDTFAILPSVARPDLDPAQRIAEGLAREVLLGQDIPWLQRVPGDTTPTSELLARKLKTLLR